MTDILLTAAQMRALEQAAIDSGSVTGLELMERAGAGAVEAILAEWPELGAGSRAVVLCGPGNNGGDGFVVARLLRERGWEVECLLYGDPEKLPPDARANWERWAEMGPVLPLQGAEMDTRSHMPDLTVDAIFGTGLARRLNWELCDAVRHYAWTFTEGTRVVALDIPSGLSSDTGRLVACEPSPGCAGAVDVITPAESLEVDLTLAFHAAKVGHYLSDGSTVCGRLRIVDIGLEEGRSGVPLSIAPNPGKRQGHKFDHGHALVLAGGVGQGGAARLAARAALRIGAGLVTVAPPPAALIENASRMDAIMLRAVRDADALVELLEDDRLTAICLGPGLGTRDREAALVATTLAANRATVLDGDALTLIAKDDALQAALHDACVLTPHMGEFARLAPDLAERLDAPAETGPAYSKLDAARDLAARLGCTVLLKGPDTVIAGPSGEASIHAAAYGREAPWLATAGAGDVLAGIITGLLARGLKPMEACEAAAWLHVEAARAFGPGLIAEDLPDTLPQVLLALEADRS